MKVLILPQRDSKDLVGLKNKNNKYLIFNRSR